MSLGELQDFLTRSKKALSSFTDGEGIEVIFNVNEIVVRFENEKYILRDESDEE